MCLQVWLQQLERLKALEQGRDSVGLLLIWLCLTGGTDSVTQAIWTSAGSLCVVSSLAVWVPEVIWLPCAGSVRPSSDVALFSQTLPMFRGMFDLSSETLPIESRSTRGITSVQMPYCRFCYTSSPSSLAITLIALRSQGTFLFFCLQMLSKVVNYSNLRTVPSW